MTLEKVIEALLFSAQKPLSIHEITAAIKAAEGDPASETPNEFARVKNAEVAAALEQLKVEYIQQSRAFQLVEKAEGWQLATDPGFAKWVRELFPAPKPARLSAPGLETLAIIAYRQPITRADVEAVRGVNIDGVLQTLMERGLVKIAGRAEIPGDRFFTRRHNFSSITSVSAISTNCQTRKNCGDVICRWGNL